MPDLSQIPEQELRNDRAASVMDVEMAQRLQANTIYGVERDSFIKRNQRIIAIIDAELKRRGLTC